MNRFIIVGNGFDLAHGYKTSYNDFFLHYLNNCLSELSSERKYSDKLVALSGLITERHIKMLQGESGNLSTVEKIKNILNRSGLETILDNSWMTPNGRLFDAIKKGIHNYNWVDIERLYYQELLKFVKESNSDENIDIKSIEKLNDELEFIKQKLHDYLIPINKKIKSEPILLDGIREKIYGSSIRNPIMYDGDALFIINFNYTSTIDNYIIPNQVKNTIVKNIHGKFHTPNHNLIFGYGDEMDDDYKNIQKLDENELLKHFKTFGYLQNNDYREILNWMNVGAFEVLIMGHSCGLSDRTLLNTVFEHKKCNSIQIYYHDRADKTNDFTEKTFNISRHFNDQKLVRQRVVDFERSFPLLD